jgi:MYXO-CTERM domain-containing protein
MSSRSWLLVAVVVLLGVATVVAGETDDSPGLQLIGGLLALSAVAVGARRARRGR